MAPKALSILEAVNIILSASGEEPVNALSTDITGKAEAVLDEVSREVQERGWHFNSEEDYEVSIAGDGTVTLPEEVAQFDLPSACQFDVVLRGQRLYDKKTRSYDSFGTGVLKGDAVILLEWTDLPPTARRYFAMEAGHRYQKRFFSSQTLAGFTEQDLAKAKGLFEDAESLQADRTIFDNYSVARTLDRKSGSEFVS